MLTLSNQSDPLVAGRAAAGKLYELLSNARRNDIDWLAEVGEQAAIVAKVFGHGREREAELQFWWALRLEANYQMIKPQLAAQGRLLFSRKDYIELGIPIQVSAATIDFLVVYKHPLQYVQLPVPQPQPMERKISLVKNGTGR